GLAIQQSSGWRVINSNNGLTSDAVCCVLRDHEGSLWLGTRGSGIQRWLGFEQWESWTKSDGLSNHVVWALRKDDRGRMWVGSNYGLNRLDPRTGEWRSWNVKDGLRGDKVRAVAMDRNGEVWTGAYPGGLARFSGDGKFIASYGKESGLSSEYIWGLLADRENRIWVGANGGVFRSLPATSGHPALVFEQLEIPAFDPTETFRQPIVDSRGWIWVPGTNGLARFKNGQWTRYTAQNGLLSNSTWGVAEAADGAIWVIYSEPLGVTRLNLADENKQSIKHFTADDVLSPGKSYFIGGSPNGAMWVGGERGVDADIDGNWHHVSPEDGLIWGDCDTSSFWADPNG